MGIIPQFFTLTSRGCEDKEEVKLLKILIVEDMDSVAREMARALEGLGEIDLCTPPSVEEVGGDFMKVRMPSLEKALELLTTADVVLMDRDLGTSYSSKELLPHCGGKKVISISVSSIPGMISWTRKLDLRDDKPEVAQSLRALVSKVISGLLL